MKKRAPAFPLAAAVVAGALLVFQVVSWVMGDRRPVKKIAYVGFNYHGPQAFDPLNCAILNDYLAELNDRYRHEWPCRLVLDTFFCDFKPELVPGVYERIAHDRDIILTLDFTWGKHIRQAESYIRENGLPVVVASADQNAQVVREELQAAGDTASLPFGGSALFLYCSDREPMYLLRFLHNVMGKRIANQSVQFITEDDYLLHNRFVRELEHDSVRYDNALILKQKDYTSNISLMPLDEAKRAAILRSIRPDGPTTLLLNVHSGYGDTILNFLARQRLRYPLTVVGLPQMTRKSSADLAQLTQKNANLVLVIPEREHNEGNSVSAGMRADLLRFSDARHNREIAGFYQQNSRAQQSVTWCYTMRQIFETAFNRSCLTALPSCRDSLATYFRRLHNRKLAAPTQLLQMDEENILIGNPTFKIFQRGKISICPHQINQEGQSIPGLAVGVDISDVSDIDVDKNTITCELLYWVQYPNGSEGSNALGFNFLNNVEVGKTRLLERRERDPFTGDSLVFQSYRLNGKFYHDYETFDFPFDRQVINLPITALNDNEKVHFSFDDSRIRKKAERFGPNLFKFDDWRLTELFVTADYKLAESIDKPEQTFGVNEDYDQSLEQYKRINVSLDVKRKSWVAWVLIILPLLLFSVLPIAILWSHLVKFEKLGDLMIAVLLGAVAYSINLVEVSPNPDSMNRSYLFLLLTLLVTGCCFGYLVFHDRKSEEWEERKNWFAGTAMALYLVLSLLIFNV